MHDSLILRADATPSMGTGHVMRCIALAQAAQDAGLDVCLVARLAVPWVRERLARENIPVSALEGTPPAQEDPHTLLQDLAQAAAGQPPNQCWVVLDGYHFDTACQKAVKKAGYRLLVIDDYNHLPEYHCDILLNQNVNAAEYNYCGQIDKKLLGLEYVLLRREFRNAPQREPRTTVKNILVTLGGGDFSIHLENIACTMQIPEMQGRVVRVIAGAMPHERIREAFMACLCTLEILSTVDDMAALLAETDLCVTAGGATCWELCALGVPFLVVSLAENQQDIVAHLVKHQTAKPFCTLSFQDALPSPRFQAQKIERRLVDAQGAMRALRSLAHADNVAIISCRDAESKDAAFILRVANDPMTRLMSLHSHEITLAEHQKWFSQQLDQKLPFYIFMYNCSPLGYVRFSAREGDAVLTLALAPEFRGKKLSTYILRTARQKAFAETTITQIHAYIKKENTTSEKIFQNVNFSPVPLAGQDIIHMVYRRSQHA